MHRAWLILLVIAVAAAAAWSLLDSNAPRPPSGAATAPAEVGALPPPEPAERAAATAPIAEQPKPATLAANDEKPAAAPLGPANVTMTVRSSATGEGLERFRVTFQRSIPTIALPRITAEGEDGQAGLAVPPGARGELLVEADGHAPAMQEIAAPRATEAPLHLDLFLDPVATATGITLAVHDPYRQPIGHVRVQALTLGEPGLGDPWADARSLWVRRTGSDDGVYELPELAPGRYGIRLSATNPDGELLPLRPFTRVFTLTGSNGFREDVILEPGCLLTLELVDARDENLDPEEHDVRIDLRLLGGEQTSRRWHRSGSSGLVAAIDAPPGPGPCFLDEAIAPGHYRLRVRVDGRLRLDQQPLVLQGGERQTERVVLR